ncbi:MAG TPA: hypothetical protein VKY92_01155 [Verrucomicrobiae bacterium]|nr:hypothetical protein [Verrucomicrobiae bacterium]
MRNPFKMPPQVLRLCLLALAIVSSYALARYFLTPPSFRQYGWYRGAALSELQAREPVFAGKKACEECHSDQLNKLSKGEHKTLSCEACHGPGQAHSDNPDVKIELKNFSPCIRCHESNPSRPKWHKQVVSKNHYTGSKCTECHVPHSPTEVP